MQSNNKGENLQYSGFSDISMDKLRRLQVDFATERNWQLLLAMIGEVGEVSELFQFKGHVENGLKDWNAKDKEHLGDELSDVLLYLLRLADVCNIDLPLCALKKFQKNQQKYPADKVFGSSKKYTEYTADDCKL